MKVTNNTRETLDVLLKGEPVDGQPPTEGILPGETKSVPNIDTEHAQYKGRVAAAAISVERPAERRSASKE